MALISAEGGGVRFEGKDASLPPFCARQRGTPTLWATSGIMEGEMVLNPTASRPTISPRLLMPVASAASALGKSIAAGAATTTRSDGNVEEHAKNGFAVTSHAFAKPGDYIVRVERANRLG